MQIVKVIMESRSPAALAGFYEKQLELPVNLNRSSSEIVMGSSRLVFNQAAIGQDPFYHFAINIPANKIEEARDWLSARVELIRMADYNSDIADFRNWNAKSIYFFDTAGNIVELIARRDLNNDNDEPFSSNQFLSVSEIGVVYPVEHIQKNTETLIQRYELTYFDKQPPFPQFKAVGNDEGLFIIVSEGRNWYPTEKRSGLFSLKVEFEVAGKLHTETF
jgi:hypothetical protein